jgi:hypothetical protein
MPATPDFPSAARCETDAHILAHKSRRPQINLSLPAGLRSISSASFGSV